MERTQRRNGITVLDADYGHPGNNDVLCLREEYRYRAYLRACVHTHGCDRSGTSSINGFFLGRTFYRERVPLPLYV